MTESHSLRNSSLRRGPRQGASRLDERLSALTSRSGYSNKMAAQSTFNATFSYFGYSLPLGPPSPPSPPGPHPSTPAAMCKAVGGIVATSGKEKGVVCCAKSCGTCGGKDCGKHPGGHEACCTSEIFKADKACNSTQAPCVI